MHKTSPIIPMLLMAAAFPLLGSSQYNPLADLGFVYDESEIPRLMENAAETKADRIQQAFSNVTGEGLREAFCPYFADLWWGRDLDRVNKELQEILTSKNLAVRQKFRLNDHYCLVINQQFYHMYYAFGRKGTLAPGRLYPQTEKVLLEVLWERVASKSDIHLSRQSTWWMIGSENHDIVTKVSALIAAQIFMHEPDFKDRIYPDYGTGGGNLYWFHHMYSEGVEMDGPQGRASVKDGKAYTAADHYAAWVNYFDEFFTERAKRGFFLEMASPGYMGVTLTYLAAIYDLCEDEALAAKAGKFLDAVWADWAVEQINGVRGGSKTRTADSTRWADSMHNFANFYFGGKGSPQGNSYTLLLSKYRLKPIHWHLALDREGLGEFAFASRRPGAEEGVWPRPLGAERTMLCDTDSRFLRYSWVTPDYILGGQMDHPGAIHSHLSNQARWQGIIFKGEGGPRVFPSDLVKDDKGDFTVRKPQGYMRMVQHGKVLLMQQARRFFQMNPCWFPAKDISSLPYGIYFGDNLDRIMEKDGWIFVEHGDAYFAARPVMGEYADGWTILQDDASSGLTSPIIEDSYEWIMDRKAIAMKDKYAGIIFEASRRAQHRSLEDFIDDVLDNPIFLDKTVVPGFHVLRYTGCGEDAKELTLNLANNEMPFIGGERVDYEPERLFDSPYLKSEYKSGVIEIKKGEMSLTLDFN